MGAEFPTVARPGDGRGRRRRQVIGIRPGRRGVRVPRQGADQLADPLAGRGHLREQGGERGAVRLGERADRIEGGQHQAFLGLRQVHVDDGHCRFAPRTGRFDAEMSVEQVTGAAIDDDLLHPAHLFQDAGQRRALAGGMRAPVLGMGGQAGGVRGALADDAATPRVGLLRLRHRLPPFCLQQTGSQGSGGAITFGITRRRAGGGRGRRGVLASSRPGRLGRRSGDAASRPGGGFARSARSAAAGSPPAVPPAVPTR